MKEIVQVKLENEMDLILAHKRAMKISELTGFSLIQQTTIATAVSEISRCAIEFGNNATLSVSIDTVDAKKVLKLVIKDDTDFSPRCADAISYAKRLLDNINVVKGVRQTQIVLQQKLNFSGTLTDSRIDSFINYFKSEAPISPYDEIRRKNLMLQELADKLQASENDYRILAESLPLMMFSVNNRAQIIYTNTWLQNYLGSVPKELNPVSWKNFIHPDDYTVFSKSLSDATLKQTAFKGQYRFRDAKSENFLWHMVSILPLKNEKGIISHWTGFIVDIHAQKQVEQALKDNRELKEIQKQLYENQEELEKKIIELNRSNYELEQFAHLASHDLQEPLRKLFFYSDSLKRKYSEVVDDNGKAMIQSMNVAALRMKELINDLLSYSQLQKQTLEFEEVDLTELMTGIIKDFDLTLQEKNGKIDIEPLPFITGNTIRLQQLFTNLVGNALKYCSSDVKPHVRIMAQVNDGSVHISVADNGIGFDEQYKEKIFGLFERLHTRDKFPGTGIGLSICKRITELHRGSISARSTIGQGSVFEVVLPLTQS